MRAGISIVQQTLTPEAAIILKRAIADAQRRGHAQVTPLHVASSLLSSPSSMLQQACIQSHRHVPHPLQCRALDLCFNVALDRLPATLQQHNSVTQIQNSNSNGSPTHTSLSNALVAALKRAQAHQRRGCPEQQQVPLLAVKVEMEQLVISILDDPSVSRVMREAGFSSTRAKSSLEACCNAQARGMISPLDEIRCRIDHKDSQQMPSIGICANRTPPDSCKSQEVLSAVMGVLTRSRKQRNPVLLGDEHSTNFLMKEVGKAIASQEQGVFRGSKVLFVDAGFGTSKEITQRWIMEISKEEETSSDTPVVVMLGDLSWCMEQSAITNAILGELGRILSKAESKKFWYVGAASSQCYMRFLAHYPSMESRLGFQPLPISVASIRPRFSLGERTEQTLPRLPKMPFRLPEEEELSCCSECTAKFELESLTFLQEQQSKAESVQSSSGDSLPFWMKSNKYTKVPVAPPSRLQTQEFMQELRRKWNRTCQTLHALKTLPNLIDANSSSSQTSSPERAKASSWLSLSTITQVDVSKSPSDMNAPSLSLGVRVENSKSSKVTTELALGTPSSTDSLKLHHDRIQDVGGCTRSSSAVEKGGLYGPKSTSSPADLSSLYKSLVKGLREKVPWQSDAAAKVASTVVSCRSGERRRGMNMKGDAWIHFTGPDCMGKRKLADALAELVFGDESLVLLSLNPQGRSTRKSLWQRDTELEDGYSRGKTITDRIAEALKSKPFSVVLLEDYDQADLSVKRNLVKSMQRGKIQHSSGREVSFGNAIIILTASTSKGYAEEMLERVQVNEASLSVVVDKGNVECKTSEIVIIDEEKGCGDEGRILLREVATSNVGEKRKGGCGWGDKLESLLGRSGKKLGLDLNLGLPGGGDVWEKGGGVELREHCDEVVEFQELDMQSVAMIVMEKLERLSSGFRVNIEIDVRALEMIVAGVLGNFEASFEKWFKESVEAAASTCDMRTGSVVRIVEDKHSRVESS